MNARHTFTIENGVALSGELDLTVYKVVGVIGPSGWDAADLTFQASLKKTAEGGTYTEVFKDAGDGTDTAVTLGIAADQTTLVNAEWQLGGCFIKVRSGTSGVPVNQTADRTLTLLLAPLS